MKKDYDGTWQPPAVMIAGKAGQLVLSLLALAIVLDLIPMPKWPQGGSLSIAAVPIIFISYRHGLLGGLPAGFVYAVIQLLTGWYAPPCVRPHHRQDTKSEWPL